MESKLLEQIPEPPPSSEGLIGSSEANLPDDPSPDIDSGHVWRGWSEFYSDSVQRAISHDRTVRQIHERFVARRYRIADACARNAVFAAAAQHVIRRNIQAGPRGHYDDHRPLR